jgi:TM2 domain-containing membrane protein YozV
LRAGAVSGTFRGVGTVLTYSQEAIVAGQGSAGNVIAALASFFIPGLGQLIQGRLIKAALMFVMAAVLWIFLLGWVIHLWSIIDAALWKPDGS